VPDGEGGGPSPASQDFIGDVDGGRRTVYLAPSSPPDRRTAGARREILRRAPRMNPGRRTTERGSVPPTDSSSLHRASTSSGVIGICLTRAPTALKIALATAGATTARPVHRRRSGDAGLDDLDIDLRDLRQPDGTYSWKLLCSNAPSFSVSRSDMTWLAPHSAEP